MRLYPFLALPLFLTPLAHAGGAPEKGTVQFTPVGDQRDIPERYRLKAHSFNYQMETRFTLPASGLTVYRVRFPSPIESPHRENNTVYAEYYRPDGKGPFPAVIILDITGGDQSLSRGMGTYLAQKGIAGLFVQMAYYGPRRPPGSRLRLMSPDLGHTINAIRQTVLDLRRATAWLAARPETDRKRLGIVGTSLGSMVGALAAEMEPRLSRVAVLLGGGGLVEGFYDHPKGAAIRAIYERLGGTREKLARLIRPIDPLTCAANLKDRKVLVIAGKRDDVVPPKMSVALWEACGRQKIVWYDCTHIGAVLYLVPAMAQVVEHFRAP
jgi:dienelactone hydrolase